MIHKSVGPHGGAELGLGPGRRAPSGGVWEGSVGNKEV